MPRLVVAVGEVQRVCGINEEAEHFPAPVNAWGRHYNFPGRYRRAGRAESELGLEPHFSVAGGAPCVHSKYTANQARTGQVAQRELVARVSLLQRRSG